MFKSIIRKRSPFSYTQFWFTLRNCSSLHIRLYGLFYLVKSAFTAYEKNKENDTFTLQFVALIAVNYLNCCYHQNAEKKYVQVAIEFLKTLPVDPVIGFYRIIGTYYEAVFSNNTKIRDMIIEILKKINYYSLIQDTVEDIKKNKRKLQ